MDVTAAETERSFLADAKVISLIGIAHFFSHFYILLLPPLFPVMKAEMGLSYSELAVTIAVFSGVTGVTQIMFGFLVDRFGARGMLIAAMVAEGLIFMAIGWSTSFWSLLFLMAAAGVANGVYHPADYAILAESVSKKRMGRAFSLHTFSGFLGFALAPMSVIFLSDIFDWRTALMICGAAGVVTAVILLLQARSLQHQPSTAARTKAGAKKSKPSGFATAEDRKLLFSPAILMCLVFFALLAMGSGGINNFLIVALDQLHGIDLSWAGTILSTYLFGSTFGILAGGVLADRTQRHNLVAAVCFVTTAVMIYIVGAVSMPVTMLLVLMGVQGFMHGLIMPSRDMIVRSVTPDGCYGKVFGFVTTGFSVGGVVAPTIFGAIMDHGAPQMVFNVIAGFMLVSVLTVLTAGRRKGA